MRKFSNEVGIMPNYPVRSMQVIQSENITPFDVDGTLILTKGEGPGRIVDILDPVTGNYIQMSAHEPNIRLLEEEAHRGSFVIVWSRGGYEWATNVITALGLGSKVNLVMSKPMVYFDDLSIEKWLPYRVFLKPDEIYKKQPNKGE